MEKFSTTAALALRTVRTPSWFTDAQRRKALPYRDLYLLNVACRPRDFFPVHPHTFDMKLDSLLYHLARFFKGRRRGDAAWKIGHVCAEAGVRWLNKNGVCAHFGPDCFSIDAAVFGAKSADGMSRNGYSAELRRVSILRVTSARSALTSTRPIQST